MYVCVCNAVTERHIEQAVQLGAKCLWDLRQTLGVGAECRRCAQCARQSLSAALAQTSEHNEAVGLFAEGCSRSRFSMCNADELFGDDLR